MDKSVAIDYLANFFGHRLGKTRLDRALALSIKKYGVKVSSKTEIIRELLLKAEGDDLKYILETIFSLHTINSEEIDGLYNACNALGFSFEYKELFGNICSGFKFYRVVAMGSEYSLLKELELKLRAIIQRELSKKSENWWNELVPKSVRNVACKRKEREEKLWPWLDVRQDLPLIHYINFRDYAKIINKNWDICFKFIFADREIIIGKLKELEPIRNKIAHFRPLTEDEKKKLQLYSKEILSCIKKHL